MTKMARLGEIGEALVKAGHYAAADIRRSVRSVAPKVRRLAAAVLERRKVLSKTSEFQKKSKQVKRALYIVSKKKLNVSIAYPRHGRNSEGNGRHGDAFEQRFVRFGASRPRARHPGNRQVRQRSRRGESRLFAVRRHRAANQFDEDSSVREKSRREDRTIATHLAGKIKTPRFSNGGFWL